MKNKLYKFVWTYKGEKCVTTIVKVEGELITSVTSYIEKEVHKKALKKLNSFCSDLLIGGMISSNIDYWKHLMRKSARRYGFRVKKTVIDLPIVVNSSELECNC